MAEHFLAKDKGKAIPVHARKAYGEKGV